jgi:hypothetical protein
VVFGHDPPRRDAVTEHRRMDLCHFGEQPRGFRYLGSQLDGSLEEIILKMIQVFRARPAWQQPF